MSLLSSLIEVYKGVRPPEYVVGFGALLPSGATLEDVALVTDDQKVIQPNFDLYENGYYVYDGAKWVYENEVIADGASTPPSSGVTKFINTNYSAVNNDIIYADASLGAFTITLPDPATNNLSIIKIVKVDDTNNRITVKAISGNVSDEAEQLLKKQTESFIIECNGLNWWIK